MAQLIRPGWLNAEVEQIPEPPGGFTREFIRSIVPRPVSAKHIPGGLVIFFHEYTESDIGVNLPNLRAGVLCGYLVAGSAVVVGPAENVVWTE